MKLHLIRHPRPDVAEGTCYGRKDVAPDRASLDDLVERLRARWTSGAHPPPHAVYSSPLQRCSLVARALAGDPWPEPVFDARLAEMDFGHWEGMLWPEIPKEQLDAWRADFIALAPPGGESVAQMADRAAAFAAEFLSRARAPEGVEVVVVTHAGIIQTLPRVLSGAPMAGFRMTRLDYGTITTLVLREGRFEVDAHNVAP
jgi:alpha-ribazole phosphatase